MDLLQSLWVYAHNEYDIICAPLGNISFLGVQDSEKEICMARIFVRNRHRVGKGAGQPRFAFVAVEGLDLKVYARHIRRKELEALAEAVGAEVVFLPGGDGNDGDQPGEGGGGGRGRRHGRQRSGEE
jgi:hypothetical protein